MSSASDNPMRSEPRRFSIRLPRPLWIGLAAAMLILIAFGLRFGLPIYRQHAALQEIKRLGGIVYTVPAGPAWLRDWIGDERMERFEDIVAIDFRDTRFSDGNL